MNITLIWVNDSEMRLLYENINTIKSFKSFIENDLKTNKQMESN